AARTTPPRSPIAPAVPVGLMSSAVGGPHGFGGCTDTGGWLITCQLAPTGSGPTGGIGSTSLGRRRTRTSARMIRPAAATPAKPAARYFSVLEAPERRGAN